MEVRPVANAERPSYPQREELLAAEKDLLGEHKPAAWRRLGSVAGLLIAANLTGCGVSTATTADSPMCPDPVIQEAGNWVRVLVEGKSTTQVVPEGGLIMEIPCAKEDDGSIFPPDPTE